MAKSLPVDIDEFFIIGMTLLFLLINFNFSIASVYSQMMTLLLFMYITPFILKLQGDRSFKWMPIKEKNKSYLPGIIAGAISAAGFILFYNGLKATSSLAQVFATTAFGESVFVGKFMFAVIIPIIETVFFFRIVLQWITYLLGWDKQISPFSGRGFTLAGILGLIFAIFHATAKGVTNNVDLMATFFFGFLSVMMILYFREVIQAIMLHIFVNSYSIWSTGAFSQTTLILISAVVIIIFYTTTKNKSIKFFG
jgi:hypothetical protein